MPSPSRTSRMGRQANNQLGGLKRMFEYTFPEEFSGSSSSRFSMEKLTMFAASVGFAFFVCLFVLLGPSPKPRKRGKVIGINNLGHTCFLNSLLQAIGSCFPFTKWLGKEQEKKNRKFTKTLFSTLNKINGFDEDFYGNVTPNEIISSLGSSWNFGTGHQDAHELFHIILNALEDEIQPVYRNGSLSDVLCGENESKDILSTSKPGMILARSPELLSKSNGEYTGSFWSWKSLFTMPYSNTLSLEKSPFTGLITSQLQCSTCMKKVPQPESSVRYDKFESLLLPLPPSEQFMSQFTLEELLTRFVDSEVVNDVQCDRCSLRCAAIKTLRIGKLPECLCLHISRTTWSISGSIKREDRVTFPRNLVLDPYIYKTEKRNEQGNMKFSNNFIARHNKFQYQLCAVIEHRGPVDSGHFACYRRAHKENMWLYTSDIVVESVSLTQVLLANPYMLFYERVKASQKPLTYNNCS